MDYGCKNMKPRKQRGGMVSSPSAFPQGAPWNVETALPGMDGGVADVGNFYRVNPEAGALPDPVSSNNTHCGLCSGGRRHKRRGTKKARKSRRGKRKTLRRRKSKKPRKARKGRKIHRRKTMRGGSTRDHILQEPINAYRGALFGAGDLVNQWSGKAGQLSPAPTDQAPVPNGDVILGEMPDVNAIHAAAGQAVANI